MRITIELPDSILERTKIVATCRRTTIENLVMEGLQAVLRDEAPVVAPSGALDRLRQGYHLGGKPMSRDQVHAR